MKKLDSRRRKVFLVFAGLVFIFAGVQFYGLHISNGSLMDVLSVVSSLGLIATLIALANISPKDKVDVASQSDNFEENNDTFCESPLLEAQVICNAEADQYFSEIKNELNQVERLVNDAVNNLVINFKSISKLSKNNHEMVLVIERFVTPEESQLILTLLNRQIVTADKIEQELEAAVTSLQFGDLVTQLLVHTESQVETLNKVLQRIDRQGCSKKRDLQEIHTEISTAIENTNTENRRKPVAQQGMEMGEVELFNV